MSRQIMRIRDALMLRRGDRVRVLPRAICARRLGVGTVLTVATVDGPRLSPWITTTDGDRLGPWEVEIAG
jgi:hypothetical protein